MHRCHLRGAIGAVTLLAAFASLSTASAGGEQIYRGPALPLAEGTAQAWVALGPDGQATALGVSLSEAALQTVETLTRDPALTLPFPAEAAGTGFDHVFLNWNPNGHPPAGIWGTPHFDVHFYMTSAAEREAISDKDPEFTAKAERSPDARFFPAGYIVEAAVPGMGVHWADAATPEFHGKPFSHTLIYGAWDGRVTFIEPMVDKSVFDRREAVVAPVKQPEAVMAPGLYPTHYRIDYDPVAAEHRIVFEGLIARE